MARAAFTPVARRPPPPTALPSPCGRHVVAFARGALHVDGRRVHAADDSVSLLIPPVWRHDGRALAWIERTSTGGARVVVLPDVTRIADLLPYPLPAARARDLLFWDTPTRVVVGPRLLAPRAVVTWTETILQRTN